MCVGSKLKTALTATALPVEQDVYTGTAATYIVFNYWTTPIWNQDDAPTYEQVNINVHLFAPMTTNLEALIAQIKALLAAAGYAYPETRNLTDDKTGRHIVFDTAYREAVA